MHATPAQRRNIGTKYWYWKSFEWNEPPSLFILTEDPLSTEISMLTLTEKNSSLNEDDVPVKDSGVDKRDAANNIAAEPMLISKFEGKPLS